MKCRIKIYVDHRGETFYVPGKKEAWYHLFWHECIFHYRTEQEALDHIKLWKDDYEKEKFKLKYSYKEVK